MRSLNPLTSENREKHERFDHWKTEHGKHFDLWKTEQRCSGFEKFSTGLTPVILSFPQVKNEKVEKTLTPVKPNRKSAILL